MQAASTDGSVIPARETSQFCVGRLLLMLMLGVNSYCVFIGTAIFVMLTLVTGMLRKSLCCGLTQHIDAPRAHIDFEVFDFFTPLLMTDPVTAEDGRNCVHPSNVGSMGMRTVMYSSAVLAIWCSWLDAVARIYRAGWTWNSIPTRYHDFRLPAGYSFLELNWWLVHVQT